MRTELWEILVPTIKDGKSVRTRYHRVWDQKVRAIANGLTILTPAKGQWVDADGNEIHERMIPVRIACSYGEMRAIAKMTLEYYNQEAVMYYRLSELCLIEGRSDVPSA